MAGRLVVLSGRASGGLAIGMATKRHENMVPQGGRERQDNSQETISNIPHINEIIYQNPVVKVVDIAVYLYISKKPTRRI